MNLKRKTFLTLKRLYTGDPLPAGSVRRAPRRKKKAGVPVDLRARERRPDFFEKTSTRTRCAFEGGRPRPGHGHYISDPSAH